MQNVSGRSCSAAGLSSALLLFSAVIGSGSAETGRADKSEYNLFNPVPTALLREMTTDRPDKTESPFTVDAGHFQIELDLVNYTCERYSADHHNTQVESWSVAPVNLKLGLVNHVDFQLVLQTYNEIRERNHATGVTQHHRGFGDIIPRLKINCWGNDGGKTAFGIIPFVKIPTNQGDLGNHAGEGGIIFPLAVALARNWDLGVMTEFDFDQDSSGRGYHSEFVNSITISHPIVGRLNGYLEFFSAVSTEGGADWIGTVDFGFTYALSENVQLDAGLNVGVTRAADDLNPFVGLSMRF